MKVESIEFKNPISGSFNRTKLKNIAESYLFNQANITDTVRELTRIFPLGYYIAAELAVVEADRQQNPNPLTFAERYFKDLLNPQFHVPPYLTYQARRRLAELDLRRKILTTKRPPTKNDINQFQKNNLIIIKNFQSNINLDQRYNHHNANNNFKNMIGHMTETMILMLINRKYFKTNLFGLLANYSEDHGNNLFDHSPRAFDITIFNQLDPIHHIQVKTNYNPNLEKDYDSNQVKIIYFNQDVGLKKEADHFKGLCNDLISFYDPNCQSLQIAKRLDGRYQKLFARLN